MNQVLKFIQFLNVPQISVINKFQKFYKSKILSNFYRNQVPQIYHESIKIRFDQIVIFQPTEDPDDNQMFFFKSCPKNLSNFHRNKIPKIYQKVLKSRSIYF